MRHYGSVLASMALCAAMSGAASARAETLFDVLGQRPGLTAIVEAATATWRADPRIAADFDNIAPARLNRLLTEQFCVLTGGDCTYTGRDMRAAHAGLNLDRAHFNALVEGLQSAMDRRGIPFGTQNRLLALLAPMQRDVVTR